METSATVSCCSTPLLSHKGSSGSLEDLHKQEKTAKVGIKIKRNKAGWDLKYLLKVLGIQAH